MHSLSLDSICLLFSLAAEYQWFMRKMNVKPAYLQAKRFSCDVFVRPPKEEDDAEVLRKLLVPAYGLTGFGRLRCTTLQETLTKLFGFSQKPFGLSMYMCEREVEKSMMVVRVHDYLYAGSPWLTSKCEQFLQN